MQSTLFNIFPQPPEGFFYWPDFLTVDEERKLIDNIENLEFSKIEMHGVVAKRRAAHFGLGYSYLTRQTKAGPPMPEFLLPLREKLAEKLGIDGSAFIEALVQEYSPGSAIGWHIDAPAFDIIAGISAKGSCTFKLAPKEKPEHGRRKIFSMELPPRSAYAMTGPVRTDWEHSIPPTDELRYSITFRTLKEKLFPS